MTQPVDMTHATAHGMPVSMSPERKNNFSDALTTRFKVDIDRYPNIYPGRYDVDHWTTSFRESPEFEHNTYSFKSSDRFKMTKEELLNSHMGPMRYNIISSFTDKAVSPVHNSPSSHSSSRTTSSSMVKPWNEYRLKKNSPTHNGIVGKKLNKYSPEAMELNEQIKAIRNLPVY